MTIAAIGPTKPDAGVIATSPATAPLAAPSTVGLPRPSQSIATQESAAAAVAVFVTTNALVARPSAASALPALKPNQPTQRSEAPMMLNGRLCGIIGSWGNPMRRPNMQQATSAEIPELIWTTVPPAKSSAPMPPLVPIQPPLP